MDQHATQIGHGEGSLPIGAARARPLALAGLLAVLAISRQSAAAGPDEGRIVTTDTWTVRSNGNLAIDGGLVLAIPAALPTGLSTGLGGGITRGETFAWGARASWSTATESTLAWTVTQWDFRLRAIAALQRAIGRATVALRLGIGATVVHETRLRIEGNRAQSTGSDLQTSALDALPAADLEAVIALHIAGPWSLMLSGGPSAAVLDGSLRGRGDGGGGNRLAAMTRVAPFALLLLLGGCSQLMGFGGPVPPLATIPVEVTGDLAPFPNLKLAVVWAAQWLTEPFCVLPAENDQVAAVIAAVAEIPSREGSHGEPRAAPAASPRPTT